MSYAGLLSFIYAKLSPDDPRVIAVKEWLGKNYTLDENPGMGAQGLYYYYQTMSKALTAANIDKLKLEDGKEADWRNDLAGSCSPSSARTAHGSTTTAAGWNPIPVLVTAYTVLALEQIRDSIPAK
jgi:squalene-hopene/tetraprenyl-beta-curcumene cyclase